MAHFTNVLRELIAGGVVLGVLVLIHEWGHFIAAKLCGVRVDVFSIGFGARIWGWKSGDTDYRVSWLPLGGYVRMAGDNPAEERTGAPYEFLSRPRWQRFVIAVAGPIMNIATTFVIFWSIFAFKGAPVDPTLQYSSDVAAISQQADPGGVQPGDHITSVNGVPTSKWADIDRGLVNSKPGDDVSITVSRRGQTVSVHSKLPSDPGSTDSVVGFPAQAAVLDEINPGSPADRAGLRSGDRIIEVNGKPVIAWAQLPDIIRNSNGALVQFVVERGSEQLPIEVTPQKSMDPDGHVAWQIGVGPLTPEVFEREGLLASLRDASSTTVRTAATIFAVLKGLFVGKVSVHDLAGPLGIARVSGQAAKRGPLELLMLTAAISLNLGILNLLPIPILDGGHVLLLLIEGGIRRDLSLAFKERFVQVGLVFLLGIFAFVMYSDILKMIQSR